MKLLILALSFFLSASNGKTEAHPTPKSEANSDPSIPTKNADTEDPLSAQPAHSGGIFHPGLASTIAPHPHGLLSHAPHGLPHAGGHHGIFHIPHGQGHHDSKPKKVRKLNHVLTDGRGNIHIKTRRIFGRGKKKSENLYSDDKVIQAKIYQHDETDGIGNYHRPYTFNHGIHDHGHGFRPHHGGSYVPIHLGYGYPTGQGYDYAPRYHHQVPVHVVPLDQGYNYQSHSPVYPVIVNHGGHGFGHNVGHHGLGTGIGHSTGHGGLGINYGHGHGGGHGIGHQTGHGVGLGHGVGHEIGHGVGLGHGVGHGIGHGAGLGHGVGHGIGHGVGYGIGHIGNGFGHNFGHTDHGYGLGHGVGHAGLGGDHGGHGPILINHIPVHGISHVPAHSISPDVGHVIGGVGRVGRGINGLASDSQPQTILIGATPVQPVQYI